MAVLLGSIGASKKLFWVIGSWEKRNLRITTNRPRGKVVREPYSSREQAERAIAMEYLLRA